ncbi:MAG: type 1 glutamine amidotransferase [Thermoanaerobaculia bacterium]
MGGSRARALLLQVRDEARAEEQEQRCFLEAAELRPDQLTCHNLVHRPSLEWVRVREFDVVMVGGAGAHTVTESYPFSDPLRETLLRLVDERRPLFASCYGHHALVNAMGGEVVVDHSTGEVGTFEIELTESGVDDPLFAGLPRRFRVQLGHHDRVNRLPEGLVELAASDRCPYQALRALGRPVYSTQFHSEMTVAHMQARLMWYRDSYLAKRATAAEVSRMLAPSDEAAMLVRRFFELYV